MKRISFLLTLLVWGALQASAQLYRYLNIEQGLSSRRVIAIEKDTKGYMWFLTQEGIDRFNGKQYVHYTLQDGDKTFQLFPNLNDLHIDKQGEIWVTGKNGYIFKYNSHADKYDLVLNFADSLYTTRRLPLTHTRMDRDNHLWLCTRNDQYIYHTKNGTLTPLKSSIQEEITDICQGQDNRYFIGTRHNVYLAQLTDNRLSVETDPLLENFRIVQHLYFHEPTQTLLIGTLIDGFYLYHLQEKTLESIGELQDVTMNAVIPYSQSKEEVLIATDGNGVYRLNLRTKQLQSYLSSNQPYANKLNGDIIKDIYQDPEGKIWMAVFPLSITIYSERYPTYHWLRDIPTQSHLPVSNQITYLLEDSDGDLWIATNNGICHFNSRTHQWKSMLSYNREELQDQNNVFISLCEAEPGVILVGGYMSGMYRINKRDLIPHYFSPQSEGHKDIRPDKYIRSIYRDEAGNIWAGGYYNFKQINLKTGKTEHYSTDYPITFITSKNEHELWIGTINGLYKFDKDVKKIRQVNISSDIGSINTIFQKDNHVTYIGTHGSGLWIYNNQTENLENYKQSNSALLSNSIFCILPSNRPDELIISTEKGLVYFDEKKQTFRNWTKEQGLLTDKFNTASGVKTRNNALLFGSDDGLIMIEDSVRLPDLFPSKLVFSDFSIQYQKMKPGMEGSPLKQSIDETESITLSHDQNIFSLAVSSINYDCPSRILYSWKMEGFYDKWTHPSESNLIRYTGLNPGNYNLKIRAILLDDGHTLEERSLRIIIQPPFTRTIWAYGIYTLLLTGVMVAITRYVWLRKDSLISKEKIRFFIHTAHDIRTPLTLIKGPLAEISRTESLSEKGMNHLETAIQSTDRLSELATKLIDFQKEELYSSSVHVQYLELNQYLRQFLSQFKMYAEQKKLQWGFKGTDEPLYAWIDPNKIDSILHNLVSNALKYTPEGGSINIGLHHHANEWFLKVSDTGIGIPSADQKKMFKHLFRGENAVNQRITGTGIGMLQTARLVNRHMGKIQVSSKENKGTTFQLRFPIDHKKFLRQANQPAESPHSIVSDVLPKDTATRPPTVDNAPRLLVVEDNPDLRSFLRQSLSESYRIEEAENGQEALQLIARQQPDLIVSDIMMPLMRGDEMCQTLKSRMETSHIPVILLTALGDRESILHGLEIKADSYVVKPFDMELLKANIASILANKEFIRQRFAQLNYRTEDLPQEIQEAPGLELDQEFLIKATELVKKNLGKDFNVDDLCMEMGMSRSSLYNKVKALTDRSPSDFVRQIRMKEAASLLRSKKFTVAEVSDMMGYSDPKYFTDIFKKHFGVTPSAYMKQT